MKLTVFLNGGLLLEKDYEQLKTWEHFSDSVISAFTATADEEIRADINQKLTNGKGRYFISSIVPTYHFLYKKKSWQKQFRILRGKRQPSRHCVCVSKSKGLTEQCAEFFTISGFNAYPFHAGLKKKRIRYSKDKFMTEDKRCSLCNDCLWHGNR